MGTMNWSCHCGCECPQHVFRIDGIRAVEEEFFATCHECDHQNRLGLDELIGARLELNV